MVTRKHFVYERKSVPSDKNTEYIMRRNPLLVLDEHARFDKPGCVVLLDTQKVVIDRILGNQDIGRKLHTIYRISASVFVAGFKEAIMQLLYGRELDIQKSDTSVRRIRTGSLETPWSEMDIGMTKHHIIPSNRDGIDDDRNYVYLPEYVHADLHRIFYTFTPLEQIAYLILLYYTPDNIEFSRKVSQLILGQNQNSFYRLELIKNGEINESCFISDVTIQNTHQ